MGSLWYHGINMARYSSKKDDSQLPPEHRRIHRDAPGKTWMSSKIQERAQAAAKAATEVATQVVDQSTAENVAQQIIIPEHKSAPSSNVKRKSEVPLPGEILEAEAPVAQINEDALMYVRVVISLAIEEGASDVHFEPMREMYQVRIRVDGVLQKVEERALDEYQKVLNSVKVLADLDISEHTVPQDGHIELLQEAEEGKAASSEGKHYYDIRVSVFPAVNGEVIVMRILNRANALLSIEQLGMDPEILDKLNEALLTSFGMILITGPTGSGKTTTLYSVLGKMRSDEKNIITLEDPIEFHLDWLRQCEINTERNFTFEKAMESVLRQDPDILMVGEIRDPHTAEHAVQSALVGRIVGSTIHANTTIGTIARLIELGIPRSIVGHTLNAIIAQRLVRKTCDKCKVIYEPDRKVLKHFGLENEVGPFFKGKGCDECKGSGYKGRTGIYSLMTFPDEIRNMLFDQKPLIDIYEHARLKGMKTLQEDAAMKIFAGITTAEEAARII